MLANPSNPVAGGPRHRCDSHFHVFGPLSDYPVGTDLRYAPPLATFADYTADVKTLGISRFVFVQPSAYWRDNSCMLDAMRALDPAVRRGIVDVDEDAPDRLLGELDAIGVRGVRINVRPIEPLTPGLSATLLARIDRLAARCKELGWHLDFLLPGWLTTELLPVLRDLPVDFTLAHMGMFQASEGVSNPGFQGLLDLLAHGRGHAWIKLTGAYRFSKLADYADIAPMARALFAAAPDRLLYGSDYPHLSFYQHHTTRLFALLAEWFPEARDVERVLIDNPAQLYGF
jgi:predicted TIM-barrel fold metal-dependent hydrolase